VTEAARADITGGSDGGVNPGDPEHPYRQIAASLRLRIETGEWAAGERLPSIPALAGGYEVAKQTVQRAVDQLRVEGVLITKPGLGIFVRGTRRRLNRLARGRYGPRRGYHADLAARYRQELIEIGHRPAPAEVAHEFGVAVGTLLLVRRHLVRTDDGQPVEVGASWLRPGLADGTSLAQPRAFGRPLYQEVEDVTGHRYTTAADHITARLPSREEAALLQSRADTPVLHLLHVAYDEDRRPIEVSQATWPGPVTTLTERYAVPAPDEQPLDAPDEPSISLA
jgi:GntR family transcriptional regulator